MSLSRVLCVLLLAGGAACSARPALPGSYQLIALDGDSLPALADAGPCPGRILGGSLLLGADSSWHAQLVGQGSCTAPTETNRFVGRYTTRGAAVLLLLDSLWVGADPTPSAWTDSLRGGLRDDRLRLAWRRPAPSGAAAADSVIFELRRLP